MINNGSSYYNWLLSLIDGDCNDRVLYQLHSIYYIWVFDLDRNRSEAGLNLRKRYAYEADIDLDEISGEPCTVLEMLISTAIGMAETDEQPVKRWFWEMVDNLGIINCDDDEIIFKVNRWMTHNYEPDGKGSIFPLKNPKFDCRFKQVYALQNAYMLENSPVDWRLR